MLYGRRCARANDQLGAGLECRGGQAAIVKAGLDGTIGDRLELLIVELASVPAGVRLERIVETKGRAEARDIEAVATRLVESLSRAQHPTSARLTAGLDATSSSTKVDRRAFVICPSNASRKTFRNQTVFARIARLAHSADVNPGDDFIRAEASSGGKDHVNFVNAAILLRRASRLQRHSPKWVIAKRRHPTRNGD